MDLGFLALFVHETRTYMPTPLSICCVADAVLLSSRKTNNTILLRLTRPVLLLIIQKKKKTRPVLQPRDGADVTIWVTQLRPRSSCRCAPTWNRVALN